MAGSKILTTARGIRAVPFYILGDLDPSLCFMAYEAENSASYNDSIVNLISPGVYDFSATKAPDHAQGTGWTFDGVNSEFLTTGTYPLAQNTAYLFTLAIRLSIVNTGAVHGIAGEGNGAGDQFVFESNRTYWQVDGVRANFTMTLSTGTDMVVIIRNGIDYFRCYQNSTQKGSAAMVSAGQFSQGPIQFTLGRCQGSAGATRYFTGVVKRLAVYKTGLNYNQTIALVAKM